MKIKVFLLSVLAFAGFLAFAAPVKAVDIPDFPSCYNPQGSVKSGYAEGTHWIPGESSLRTGRDIVYSVNDTQLLQCFCAPDNSGIQTNWWKVSSLTDGQVNELKNLGWVFIANGTDFGLEAAPYVAQNQNINCNPTPAPQPCNGCGQTSQPPTCDSAKPTTPTLTSVIRGRTSAKLIWTPSVPATHYSLVYGTKPGVYIYGVANMGNTTTFTVNDLNPGTTYYFSVRGVNNCMPSDASANNPGQVLGLAFTGNVVSLILASISGIAFLVLFLDYFRRVKYSI